MPPRPKFSTEDSVKIVEWWCELKDIHKVRWRYAKEKGIEHFPRKLPTRKNFKCVIERFQKTGSVKLEQPKKIDEKPVTSETSGPGQSCASKWTAATLSPSSKSTSEEQLRIKNIKYAWPLEPGNVFVMFENLIL